MGICVAWHLASHVRRPNSIVRSEVAIIPSAQKIDVFQVNGLTNVKFCATHTTSYVDLKCNSKVLTPPRVRYLKAGFKNLKAKAVGGDLIVRVFGWRILGVPRTQTRGRHPRSAFQGDYIHISARNSTSR
jgi:hypothetical protein